MGNTSQMIHNVMPASDGYFKKASDIGLQRLEAELAAKQAQRDSLSQSEGKKRQIELEYEARQVTIGDESNADTRERLALEREAVKDVALNPSVDLTAWAQTLSKHRSREYLRTRSLEYLVEVMRPHARLQVLEAAAATLGADADIAELLALMSAARLKEALGPAIEEEKSLSISGHRTESLISAHFEACRNYHAARVAYEEEVHRQERLAQAKAAHGVITRS